MTENNGMRQAESGTRDGIAASPLSASRFPLAVQFAFRRLQRGWRSGELLILALALGIAVASASAVNLFTQRVAAAIEGQTGDTLGADLLVSSRSKLPENYLAQVHAAGMRTTQLVQFPSVVFKGETSALASIKAVQDGFPLRGRLTLANEAFGEAHLAQGIPAPGEAWVDQRLLQELGIGVGETLKAGAKEFRIAAVVVEEPGRGAGFADLAPRLMLNQADLAATQLLGFGSRAEYMLQATGTPEQVSAVQAMELPHGLRLRSPQDARPELQQALKSAGEFLGLAQLAATLLSAAAIALCAWQYGQKLRDEVALLKCLGARSGFILAELTLHLLLLGVAAGIVGALLGLGAQEVIARLLGNLMELALPAPSLWPLLDAAGLSLLLLLGFALPPLLQARRVAPLRVFQREESSAASRLPLVAAGVAVLGLLWWRTEGLDAAAYVLGGAVGLLLVLGTLAWLLVLALAPLKRAVGTSWRFGLGNVARRRGSSVAQVVALGLALLALLLVSVVRQDLLSAWRDRLPADTPNQFLINIQAPQIPALREFFAQRGYTKLELWPMARGRLTELNGKPVTPESFEDPETQRWINRDFNLSWTDKLGPDNRITAGEWWGEAGHGHKWLSVDKYAVERLKLKLGDTLTLDFAGQPVTLTVHNLRTVEWDSFKPNFFLLAPPGVLEDVPAQWLTSFYLPKENRALLRELITAFPNVTPLDMDAVMTQVRSIMERIVRAVEFIFLFTLAAGVTVLLAAIEGTRAERLRETGLLRALGARAATIRLGLLAEYAVLGLLAGLTAAIAAQALASVLAAKVFHIPYGLRPMLWLTGAIAGAGLVSLLGWLSLRRVLNTPPKIVLASV